MSSDFLSPICFPPIVIVLLPLPLILPSFNNGWSGIEFSLGLNLERIPKLVCLSLIRLFYVFELGSIELE